MQNDRTLCKSKFSTLIPDEKLPKERCITELCAHIQGNYFGENGVNDIIYEDKKTTIGEFVL